MATKQPLQIEYVGAGLLKKAEYNPRKMSPAAFKKLRKNIKAFGLVDPLVINKDNTIIGGHQRFDAGVAEGYESFPCVRLDIDKQHEKALNLALNKIAGEWDFAMLTTVLSELDSDTDFDLELAGFDNTEALEITGLDHMDLSGSLGDTPPPLMGDSDKPKGASISYMLVFNNEDEQKVWHGYIKALREKYPDEGTISARLTRDIQGRDDL